MDTDHLTNERIREIVAVLREHPYTGEPGKTKMKLLRLFEQ